MYVSIRIYGKDVLKVDFLSVLKRKQNAMESVAHPYVKLSDNEKYLYCFGLSVMTLGSSKAISETKPMFEKVLDKISLSQEDRERLISDINSQFDLRITQLLKWIDKRKEIQYLLLFDMQLIAYHTLWAQSYCEKIMKEFSLLFSLEPRENEFIRLFVQATKNNNQEKARMLYDKFCADGFFITYKHLHYICPILNFNLKLSSLILDKGQKYVIDKETSIENDIMVTNGSVLVIDHAKVKLGGSIRIDGGEIYITDSEIVAMKNQEYSMIELVNAFRFVMEHTMIDCNRNTTFLRQYAGDVTLKNCVIKNSVKIPSIFFLGEDMNVVNCQFENCLDGAIRCSQKGNLNIINTNFLMCKAEQGGAIFVDEANSTNIQNCRFEKCEAKFIGGCIYFPYLRYGQNVINATMIDCKPLDSLMLNQVDYEWGN